MLTQEKAAERIGASVKSVGRWESGERKPRMEYRRRMAEVYEVPLSVIDQTLEDTPQTGYKAPSSGLDMLATLEQSCRELRTLELTICPGLLQTERYATAVESSAPGEPAPGEVARRVAERMTRQRVLERSADPLRVFALVDPSVLRRRVGGPEVLAEQVRHLYELNGRPNVAVRLLSDAAGILAARGPFTLLTGDDATRPFMVVKDDLSSGLSYRDGPTVVRVHQELWQYVWELSDALAQVEL
jgi:transcriptional regulator with XRE-family HTH domain